MLRVTRLEGANMPSNVSNYVGREVDAMAGILAQADYYGSDLEKKGRAFWSVTGDDLLDCGVVDSEALTLEALQLALSGRDELGYQETSPRGATLSFLGVEDGQQVAERFREARRAGLNVPDAAGALGLSVEQGWKLDLALAGFSNNGDAPRLSEELGTHLGGGGGRATAAEVAALIDLTRAVADVEKVEAKVRRLEEKSDRSARQDALLASLGKQLDRARARVASLGSVSERVAAASEFLLDPASAEGADVVDATKRLAQMRKQRTELKACDLTFSAPKSISILAASLGEDQADELIAEFRGAVEDSQRFMVEEAVAHGERRVGGEVSPVDVAQLRSALVIQLDSRDGTANLHCHGITMLAGLMDDAARSNIKSDDLARAAKPVGMYFQSRLRERLAEKWGFEFESVGNGQAEIKGFPPELLACLSGRSDDILEALDGFKRLSKEEKKLWKEVSGNELEYAAVVAKARSGLELDESEREQLARWEQRERIADRLREGASQAELSRASLQTRDLKAPDMSEEQVRRHTAERLAEMGGGYAEWISQVLSPEQVAQRREEQGERVECSADMVREAIDSLAAESSQFGLKQVFERLMEQQTETRLDPDSVMDAVRAAPETCGLVLVRDTERRVSFLTNNRGQGARFATSLQVQREVDLAAKWARLEATQVDTGVDDHTRATLVASLSTDPQLVDDPSRLAGQAAFADALLRGDSRIVVGLAGAGKSYVVGKATPLLQAEGRRVVVSAPSAIAALQLGEESGADVAVNTELLRILLANNRLIARYDKTTQAALKDLNATRAGMSEAEYETARMQILRDGAGRQQVATKTMNRGYGAVMGAVALAMPADPDVMGEAEKRKAAWDEYKVVSVNSGGAVVESRTTGLQTAVTVEQVAGPALQELGAMADAQVAFVPAGKGKGADVKGLVIMQGAVAVTQQQRWLEGEIGALKSAPGPWSDARRERMSALHAAARQAKWDAEKAAQQSVLVGKEAAEAVRALSGKHALSEDHAYVGLLDRRLASLQEARIRTTDKSQIVRIDAAVRAAERERATVTSKVLSQSEPVTAEQVKGIVTGTTAMSLHAAKEAEELLGMVRLDENSPGITFVMDEAGMASTETIADLLGQTREGKDAAFLVGDGAQLGSVRSAGGMFRLLSSQISEHTIVLDEIRRLREDPRLGREGMSVEVEAALQKAMSEPVRKGRVLTKEASESVVARYHEAGRIRFEDSREELLDRILADYKTARMAGESALMLASTNRDVDALNAAYNTEQREYSARVVALEETARAGDKAARKELTELLEATTWRDEHGKTHGMYARVGSEALQFGGTEYRSGEQVMLRNNDSKQDVWNGTLATVVDVQETPEGATEMVVRLDDGREATVAYDPATADDPELGPQVQHAAALTIYKSQGQTVDRSLLFAPGSGSLTSETGYVAMSRGRYENSVYTMPAQKPQTVEERKAGTSPPQELTEEGALVQLAAALRTVSQEGPALEVPDMGTLERLQADLDESNEHARVLGMDPAAHYELYGNADKILAEAREEARAEAERSVPGDDPRVKHHFRRDEHRRAAEQSAKQAAEESAQQEYAPGRGQRREQEFGLDMSISA